jgi:hypothetical protein
MACDDLLLTFSQGVLALILAAYQLRVINFSTHILRNKPVYLYSVQEGLSGKENRYPGRELKTQVWEIIKPHLGWISTEESILWKTLSKPSYMPNQFPIELP